MLAQLPKPSALLRASRQAKKLACCTGGIMARRRPRCIKTAWLFRQHSKTKRLDRTLVQSAANGRKEPNLFLGFSRCVRSQRQECHVSKEFGAAMQRKQRSFIQAAARIKLRIHKSRTKPKLDNCVVTPNGPRYCRPRPRPSPLQGARNT
jgi:hypothetical protein